MLLLFSENENEEPGADMSEKDDEIFFGPVGHTEKCVAVGVNEVAQASHRLQPLSPLSATQMAELCREAYTVAYQIEHVDFTRAPYSHSETTGVSFNDVISRTIYPVRDLVSSVTVAYESESTGGTKMLSSHAETTEATISDNPVEDMISNVSVSCYSEHASSAKPLTPLAEATEATSIDEVRNDNPVTDLTSSIAVAYQNEHCSSSVPPAKSTETVAGSCNVELSYINQVEDLSVNAADADSGPCLDEALSHNSFNDVTFDGTENRGESVDNMPSSSNAFEGLLSSLGSALPVVEPGSLKQDEQGVVKFTAADSAATNADTKTKCRSGIPAPRDLRRASSAKLAGTRSCGIPMKVLTVSHLLCWYILFKYILCIDFFLCYMVSCIA